MSDVSRPVTDAEAPPVRAVGAPLSRGGNRHQASNGAGAPPNAVAANGNGASNGGNSRLARAAGALRAAVPFVQRLLPLLEGNIAGAVTNMLVPQAKSAPPPDTTPLEEGLAVLNMQQHALSEQVAEQQTVLKRVEDRLQSVREATDRNTLEQQELMENLKSVGRKVNGVAIAALVLLVLSVVLNLFLVLHLEHIGQ